MTNTYKFIYDKEGFIIGAYATDEASDWTGQLAEYPELTRGWYKLDYQGSLIIDTEKKEQIEKAMANALEIAELRQNLRDTDYIMAETFEEVMTLDNAITFIADIIVILKKFKQQYASVLASRKAWRERIEELKRAY